MSQQDDGGTAFPVVWQDVPHGGMSLRDWFAGQALAGVIATCAGDTLLTGQTAPQMFAQKAYAVADAMLAARKAQGGGS